MGRRGEERRGEREVRGGDAKRQAGMKRSGIR